MTNTVIRCGENELNWTKKTIIMGVLNVTPDSFSDGGKYLSAESAQRQVELLLQDGAHIIDIGGESTRPFAHPVSLHEELKRVIPVIKAIRSITQVPISVDTTKAEVARQAIEQGADIINDISALRMDPEMVNIVSKAKVPVVIMHMKGTPQTMQKAPYYQDVIKEIDDFFEERIEFCRGKGIKRDRIILDPGIGFGKRYQDNLDIINGLSTFARHGLPVLVGPSRKAFLGEITGEDNPEKRDIATSGAVVACAINGASMVRVHNIAAVADALKVIDALKQQKLKVTQAHRN